MRFIVHSTLYAVQNLVFSNYLHMQSKNSTNNTLQKIWLPPLAPNKTHVNYVLNNRWFCFQCTLERRYAFCFAFQKNMALNPNTWQIHTCSVLFLYEYFSHFNTFSPTSFHQLVFTNSYCSKFYFQHFSSIFNSFFWRFRSCTTLSFMFLSTR